MGRFTTLYAGSGWSLGLWRCDAPEPGTHAAERTGEHQVVFPTHGAYGRRIDGAREILDATRVVYFNAGEWYEVDHPVPGGDRCTVISLQPSLVEALAAEPRGLRDGPGGTPRFPDSSRPSHGHLHLAQHRLRMRIERGAPDPVALDEAAFELLGATLPPVRAATPSGLAAIERAHARAVDRALEKIHAEFRSPLTVADVARAAAYSPFHLGRVFRARVGLTLHRYITRLRLREALHELTDEHGAIGAAALRFGFSSHSHFSDAFRREFGASPSSLRA